MSSQSHFYHDKPLFGLDLGFSSMKVMQIEKHGRQQVVKGYGVGGFNNEAIKDGVIVDYEQIAKAAYDLFDKNVIGSITTKRVALTIPATRTFTRAMNLPPIEDNELAEAVNLETEQYVPMPIKDLYIDYNLINRNEKGVELLAVAIPRNIVDSHLNLSRMLGLETVAIDTSILAAGRLFQRQNEHGEIPAVLIDFGSNSADITVHDGKIIVTGTIACGGDLFSELIAKKLNVSHAEAHVIKTKYGLGKSKKQKEIVEALQTNLEQLAKEIRRMIRYHEERSGSQEKIGQIITMGGGANMPGLSDYLTSVLRLPVRMCDPWQNLHLHRIHPPNSVEKSMYVTVAGLSLIEPKELFA